MKKHFILIPYFTLCFLPMVGQVTSPPSPVLEQFRNDISPQVEMMNQYGTYPVNLSNGLVDISIPLYEINTPGGLKLPLGISFHASGLRATEREGVLGVRWVLDGAGFISRTIKGYPDLESGSDYKSRAFNAKVSNPNYNPDFYDLYGTTGTQHPSYYGNNSAFTSGVVDYNLNLELQRGEYKDTEHDIYSYSLPSGKSGKFIWKKEESSTNDEIWKGYTMPYEPIRASPARIIDENGITYSFGEGVFWSTDRDDNITTRYLTSIVSQNRKDKITIDYVRCGNRVNVGRHYAVVSGNSHGPNFVAVNSETDPCEAMGSSVGPLSMGLGNLLINGYFKEEREADNGNQEIPYSINTIRVYSEGKLTCSVNFNYREGSSDNYLKEIVVKNSLGLIIRNIQFAVKRNSAGVKFLDKLSFISSTDNNETYTFDYYGWASMPACGSDYLKLNSDWWGFYSNGGGWLYSGTMSIDTPQGIKSRTIFGGDKMSRSGSMMTGMIKSICYPTGGKTTFEYEGNEATDLLGNRIKVGGLRICNITNQLSSGKKETKHYEYSLGDTPFYLKPPQDNYLYYETYIDCYAYMECMRYAGHVPASDAEWGDYRRRVYQGYFPDSYTAFSSNIVSYSKVTEYDMEISVEGVKELGKTVYEFSLPNRDFCMREYYENLNGNEFQGDGSYRIQYINPKDFWIGNKLLSKTYYEGERRIKEILYEYQPFRKSSIYDLPVYRYRNHYVNIRSYDSSNDHYKEGKYELSMIYPDFVDQTFAIKHQEYTIGAERLVKETENTFFDNNTMISVKKEIIYDDDYLLPIREYIVNSDSIRMLIEYAYPFSSQYKFDDVYKKMLSENRNYITPIINKTIYKDNSLADHTATEYTYTNVNYGFYPIKKSNESSNTIIDYHNYSSAMRPMYITRNGDNEKVVYLWSYYQQYPIAEIRNVTYNEVCDALDGENFVTELADKIAPSSTDYKKIRDIRNTLPDAQITTAEYQPLVGVTKTTDPKGLTMYYEYNSLGKLVRTYIILDNKPQTIERYDYHSTNQ